MDKTELTHLLISWITLSIAFSVNAAYVGLPSFLTRFPLVLIGLGTGFIFHEMAHRYVARRYGCWAVFRAWSWGLVLALGMAILTRGQFLFAAPGAVYIGGKQLTPEENGKISLAGPLVNILVGLSFVGLLLYCASIGLRQGDFLFDLGLIGSMVNFFLGFFNLIPFPPLDGSKVMQWNPTAWLVAIILAGSLTFFLGRILEVLAMLLGI
ncbi:site-2 protease family protein [archaeon]|nr:site-2 protease family protein [archaeon]